MKIRKMLGLAAALAVGCALHAPSARADTRVEYIGRVTFNGLKLGYCGGEAPCPFQGVRIGEFAHLTFVAHDTGVLAGPWPPCPNNPTYTPTEIEFQLVDGSYFVQMGGVRLAAPVLPAINGLTNPATVIDWQNCSVDQMNIKGAALLGRGGSCCFPNGWCTYVLESECTNAGGSWTFGGPCYGGNACAQPLGVCCAGDNSCTVTTQADCQGSNWSYGGTCQVDSCPQEVGACCDFNHSCAVTTQANCGGTWTVNELCSTSVCVAPPFNFSYGITQLKAGGLTGFFSSAEIAQNHGVYTSFGADYRFWQITIGCGDARGPKEFDLDVPLLAMAITDSSAPMGACCAGDGQCLLTTQALCTASAIGGTWSAGTCDANPCAAPAGACCFADGSCELVLQTVCQASAGAQYLGNASSCTNGVCPVTGGCCVAGVCSIKTELGCSAASGNWIGADTTCAVAPQASKALTNPTGSCCSSVNGSCKIVFQTSCTGSTNTWTAGGTCETPCPNAGRCCFPSTGACELLNATNCASRSGTFYPGETCAEVCDPIVGACCNPVAGTCSIVLQSACTCGGDTWASDQTCAQLCPVVVGACCNTFDGSCRLVSEEFCNGSVVWIPNLPCTTACQGVGKILPDATFIIGNPGTTVPAEYTDSITVTNPGTVQSIEVWVEMSASRLNDFKLSLIGPNNAEAVLFQRIGSASPCTTTPIGPGHTLNGTYIFKDSGTTSFWSYVINQLTNPFIGPAAPGTYQASACGGSAVSLDSTFAGLPFAGTWTLKMRDERSGINLKLISWGLSINQGVNPTVCAVPCPADFDGNHFVSVNDLFAFLSAWFAQNGMTGPGLSADIDANNAVSVNDLFAYLSLWFASNGQPCP